MACLCFFRCFLFFFSLFFSLILKIELKLIGLFLSFFFMPVFMLIYISSLNKYIKYFYFFYIFLILLIFGLLQTLMGCVILRFFCLKIFKRTLFYVIKISVDQFSFFSCNRKWNDFSTFKAKFSLNLSYSFFQLLLNNTFLFNLLSIFSRSKYYKKKLSDKFSVKYY